MSSQPKSKLLPKQTKPYFEAPPAPPAARTPSIRGLTLAILPFLGIFGFYALLGLGYSDGLIPELIKVLSDPAPKFPGSNEPLIQHYTGIRVIDDILKELVPFFAPIVDYRDATCTAFTLYMFGQFGTGFALWLLEAARVGNRWRVASFVVVYGTLVQRFGWASTTPFYLIVNTLSSPLSKPLSASNPSSNAFVSQTDLRALPFSIFFGYVVPSVLMCLSPRVHSPYTLQIFAAIWQAFPIYIVLFQFVLTNVFLGRRSDKPAAQSFVSASRRFYNLLLLFCGATHLFIVALALLPPSLFESWSPELAWLASTNFVDLFVPPLPLPSFRMRDFSQGVHVFLQFDTYFSAIPATLWATMLLRNVSPESPYEFYAGVFNTIVIWLTIAGPFGPVIVLLQQRDEIAAKKIKQ